MALKFGKTPGEIWMERFTAALACGAILLGHATLFLLIARHAPRNVAGITALVETALAWQAVARAWMGSWFHLRLVLDDRSAREVLEIGFTSAFLINCVFVLYFL